MHIHADFVFQCIRNVCVPTRFTNLALLEICPKQDMVVHICYTSIALMKLDSLYDEVL